MREIKFRGKRKNGTEWLYGDLNHIDGKVYIFERHSGNMVLHNTDYYEVIPETVGEYTGLKDNNRKEVYEGDVLESIIDERLFKWLVTYENGCLGVKNIGIKGYLHEFYHCKSEYFFEYRLVIGNIYENPKLLNN